MPRFFVDAAPTAAQIHITGEDAHHLATVLRMKVGESLTVCDGQGTDYLCELIEIYKSEVICQVLKACPSVGEPSIRATLYMALAKGDKMDFIIQKAVELGANCIVPFVAARSVSRPDEKSLRKKCDRWRKIAKEAAMQSGRGCVPQVGDVITQEQAAKQAVKEHDLALFLYENEQNTKIQQVLTGQSWKSIAFMVGPEGGFADSEVQQAVACGMDCVSLGTRILRCETAPLAALSVAMYESGNL